MTHNWEEMAYMNSVVTAVMNVGLECGGCVQVNTQEYPGTLGAEYIQYMTTDRITAPPAIMLEG